MRSAKEIYWACLEEFGATNVGDILISVDNVLVALDSVPEDYIQEFFGCSKDDLYTRIVEELYSETLEEALDDF